MTTWHRSLLFTWLSALVVFSGCVNIEKSYPDKRYFVLEVARNASSENVPSAGVLQISSARVSPRYADRNFVYRRTETRFESDFYNEFLVSPSALVTEEVRRELSGAGIFRYVIGSAAPTAPTHSLETMVNTLYGDFRELAAPKAVIEIEFFLSKETSPGAGIVFHKVYQRIVPVQERTPEALVRGWNEGFGAILKSFVADLKSADLQAKS